MPSNNKPSQPITRRPLVGRRLPWGQFPGYQPPRKSPSPLDPQPAPFWPLLVACIVVLFVLQGANLAYQSGFLGGAPAAVRQAFAKAFNPTESLSNRTISALTPVRGDVTPNPTNYIVEPTGKPTGTPLTLTIFTDPACVPCRNTLKGYLDSVETGDLRLVYKYWPQNPTSLSGGMLQELARQEGLTDAFRNRLNAETESPTPTRLLMLLEQSGLPLNRQQQLLVARADSLQQALSLDAAQARTLNLGAPPQLVLNGYVLDGTILIPYRLNTYIERLAKNQSLVQSGDYWLNP